jgi:murein L,D-transpeptidase YcbB/YkuD
MRRTRFELWLATTALVAAAAALSVPAQSAPAAAEEVSAAAPMPDPANTPPSSPNASETDPQPAAGAAVHNDAAATPDQPAGAQHDIAAPAEPAAAPADPPAAPAQPAAAAVQPEPANPEPANPEPAPQPAAAAAPAEPVAPPAVAAPATPATPPAATAVEVPAQTLDQRVAEKIHEMFGGRIDRIFDRKYKAAVETFYTARNFAPLWVEGGAASERAKAAAAYLAGVSADGLDPAEYPVPSFSNADPGVLAEAELKFTATILTYARHAQIGRVHYSRVSSDISYNLVAPEPGEVLGKLADTASVADVLDSFNPPHAGYKALKAKLAEVRNRAGEPARVRIATGKTLRPGMEDPRVPPLRERLGIAAADNNIYDKALSDAVKAFQRQHDLSANGFLTSSTVDALNGPRRDHDADVIVANMERWRWLPRDLGEAYVMVNIPDYTLRVMNHGEQVWTTKIVSGKPGEKATPLLSETMKYITVNPTWHVPPSIVNNEYLPALAQDPTVLDRMGLRVEHNRDGSVSISQPPGERNALGRIRFNFPNKFLVYQHDTPDKYLFNVAKRAYSHGCMRVQYPDKYAEVLLGISNPKDGYTAEKIRRMYGTGERDIQLTTPIPVHLTYQTAFVDDAGHLAVREDIYGRDAKLLANLKGDERRIADAPVERERREAGVRRQASSRTMMMRGPQQPNWLFGGFFR